MSSYPVENGDAITALRAFPMKSKYILRRNMPLPNIFPPLHLFDSEGTMFRILLEKLELFLEASPDIGM